MVFFVMTCSNRWRKYILSTWKSGSDNLEGYPDNLNKIRDNLKYFWDNLKIDDLDKSQNVLKEDKMESKEQCKEVKLVAMNVCECFLVQINSFEACKNENKHWKNEKVKIYAWITFNKSYFCRLHHNTTIYTMHYNIYIFMLYG